MTFHSHTLCNNNKKFQKINIYKADLMFSSTSFLRYCKNVLIIYKNRYRFHLYIYSFIYFSRKNIKKIIQKVSLRLRGRKLVFLINKKKRKRINIEEDFSYFSFRSYFLVCFLLFSGRQHHQSFVYHNYIILLTFVSPSHSLSSHFNTVLATLSQLSL